MRSPILSYLPKVLDWINLLLPINFPNTSFATLLNSDNTDEDLLLIIGISNFNFNNYDWASRRDGRSTWRCFARLEVEKRDLRQVVPAVKRFANWLDAQLRGMDQPRFDWAKGKTYFRRRAATSTSQKRWSGAIRLVLDNKFSLQCDWDRRKTYS